ncbi:hypothetical protein BgiBS90_018342 [Biomphalaria glabrata]|nr:hypothetical protein BgiBS90_018342 [Biomphalaria glabrata]
MTIDAVGSIHDRMVSLNLIDLEEECKQWFLDKYKSKKFESDDVNVFFSSPRLDIDVQSLEDGLHWYDEDHGPDIKEVSAQPNTPSQGVLRVIGLSNTSAPVRQVVRLTHTVVKVNNTNGKLDSDLSVEIDLPKIKDFCTDTFGKTILVSPGIETQESEPMVSNDQCDLNTISYKFFKGSFNYPLIFESEVEIEANGRKGSQNATKQIGDIVEEINKSKAGELNVFRIIREAKKCKISWQMIGFCELHRNVNHETTRLKTL